MPERKQDSMACAICHKEMTFYENQSGWYRLSFPPEPPHGLYRCESILCPENKLWYKKGWHGECKSNICGCKNDPWKIAEYCIYVKRNRWQYKTSFCICTNPYFSWLKHAVKDKTLLNIHQDDIDLFKKVAPKIESLSCIYQLLKCRPVINVD